MHIGTDLQALKLKMALSCHADYRWICVTSLKVNETDYEWEKIKNHISGVWNSSDIGLDLGKLHNQIQTLEHSRLDFTAAGQGLFLDLQPASHCSSQILWPLKLPSDCTGRLSDEKEHRLWPWETSLSLPQELETPPG